MKKVKLLLLVLLTGAMMFGCGKEEAVSEQPTEQPEAESVIIETGNMVSSY